jgi:hypothetical protein
MPTGVRTGKREGAKGAKGMEPVSQLIDDEVLRLTAARLLPQDDRRLARLLEKQKAGDLKKGEERAQLLTLMARFETLLLRQAEALAEAVRRGLRDPLTP